MIIHVFCKSWEPEIVLICTLAEQFHVCKSYKTRRSTLLCIGNFEENIDLSRTHLAVQVAWLDVLVKQNVKIWVGLGQLVILYLFLVAFSFF